MTLLSTRAAHFLTRTRQWAAATANRGVFTVWWAIATFALIIMLGLVVDGGGKIHARQQANLVAEEAARTAGQQVVRPLGMRGIAAVSDPVTATAAAQAYLALHPEVKGTIVPMGPNSLAVVVAAVYEPKFLGLIGVGPQPVEGRAVITLNRTNNGTAGLP